MLKQNIIYSSLYIKSIVNLYKSNVFYRKIKTQLLVESQKLVEIFQNVK